MASITTVRDKNGRAVKFRARYRTPSGASRSRTFTKKADAESFLASTEHRKQTGEFVDPLAGRVTFGEYAERWLEMKAVAGRKPTTLGTWRSHLDRHLLPTFGDETLRSIDSESVETWAAKMAQGVAPTTAKQVMATLRAIMLAAVEHGRILRNPTVGVHVGAKTERRVDPLHVGNVAAAVPAIAEAVPRRWRAGVLLMASTGLRLGECLGLTVDRVDFLRRSIRIDRQLVTVTGSVGFGTPKTRAGVRTIPVPERVIALLAAHIAEFDPGVPDGLLFTTEAGNPIRRSRWADSFREARAELGLSDRVRTHDLRHVAASSLIAGGLSVAAVQAVLGHASPAETLDVYTHLWPTDEDRTREAMEAASASWLAAI